MAIVIERVDAKGLGPLDTFTGKLGQFNLIYGKNEYGKTFLVEFILKSLFRDVQAFRLRSISPTGQVSVSGLETEIIQFSPNARKKLEHYWDENKQGMPASIAQLLVVKGAELDFAKSVSGGVNKKIVQSFLSSEGILDKINEKIQSTVREANLVNGEIIGANRGELKTRSKLVNDLKQIDEIQRKVDENFSGGTNIALLARKRELQAKIEEQEKAKRYLAFAIAKSIKIIEDKNKSMEEKGLPELIDEFEGFLRKTDALDKAKGRLEELEEESKDYQWFTIAIHEYEKFLNQISSGAKFTYYYLSAFFIIGAAILTTVGFFTDQLNLNIYESVIFCGIGIVAAFGLLFGFLFFQQQQQGLRGLAQRLELKRIEAGFEEKFEKKLSSIVELKSQFAGVQKAHNAAEAAADEINRIKAEIDLKKERILNGMKNLGIDGHDESIWDEIINRLKNAYQSSQEQIQSKSLELANLDIEPEHYLEVDPGIQFNKGELNRLTAESEEIQKKIQDEDQNLEILKTEIRTIISDKTSTSWEKLLENLKKKKDEIINDYKEITGKICAGILVSQVINDVRLQEDENLKTALHAPIVQKPLFDITKRYKNVTFDGDNIIVSDGFEEFNIADLSTAASEQVLLALRLGFAAKIMNQETAFLILDDAFQHSDWQRREYLMDAIVSLALKGWQIIYFSMDDHIRDLFNSKGENAFQSEYKYFDLDKNR